VQVDSIKPRVESSCGVYNLRLKLKYDILLSSFAFKFNLRRYSMGDSDAVLRNADKDTWLGGAGC